MAEQELVSALQPTNVADLIERILDKGLVIVGDIRISLTDVELLTIKIRLLVASVERAKALGIDWWESDPLFSSKARALEAENQKLKERLEHLERRLAPGSS